MAETTFTSIHSSFDEPIEIDFLDLQGLDHMESSPPKPSTTSGLGLGRRTTHVMGSNDVDMEHASSSNSSSSKVFSPLRLIYSPSKFFRSPCGKSASRNDTETVVTPTTMLKVRKRTMDLSSTEKTPIIKMEKSEKSALLSPFSDWKVDETDKHHYRLIMSPLKCTDQDNQSFFSFAHSLPPIVDVDVNTLEGSSSPAVSVQLSPLTPVLMGSLTKLYDSSHIPATE
jgi:hypothetical protein